MRTARLAAVVLLSASLAHAQQPPAKPQAPPPPVFPPPQGPAALSVPNPLAGLQPGPRDLYQRPDGGDRFQQRPPHHATPPIFIGPGVGAPGMTWPGAYWPLGYPTYPSRHVEPSAHRTPPPQPMGGLRLETLPLGAQVFVDGYYVGTAEDFGFTGRPLELTPGPHAIEARAPGYHPLSFRVMINPNDIIRYRGDMTRLEVPAATPPQVRSTQPQPVYVIPNCFAGNRPPSRPLPAGCDRSKLQTSK